MYCTNQVTHRVKLRSAKGEFALVAVIPLAFYSVLVCADHAAKAHRLYVPGGLQYGGWVLDEVVPEAVTA